MSYAQTFWQFPDRTLQEGEHIAEPANIFEEYGKAVWTYPNRTLRFLQVGLSSEWTDDTTLQITANIDNAVEPVTVEWQERVDDNWVDRLDEQENVSISGDDGEILTLSSRDSTGSYRFKVVVTDDALQEVTEGITITLSVGRINRAAGRVNRITALRRA